MYTFRFLIYLILIFREKNYDEIRSKYPDQTNRSRFYEIESNFLYVFLNKTMYLFKNRLYY